MAEMMRMIQQLGGGRDSSGPTSEGLGLKMRRNHYHPNHDGTTLPVGQQEGNKEVDPFKDKTSKSRYS